MKAIFLADAHLRSVQDTNYQLLLDFLNQQKDLDALFLLGDIFEFWFGYEHIIFSAYIPLLEKLRQLEDKGTQLFFVEGNHDFNLGAYFTKELNCTIISDPSLVEWDSQKILLCHGDQLKQDKGYALLRAFWRSHPLRWLARIVHPDLVWRFGLYLSNKNNKHSTQRNHHDPTPYLLRYADETRENCRAIICGHFHYPVSIEHKGTSIIALGDWIHQFSYAEMLNGKLSLKSYSVEEEGSTQPASPASAS
jgi:UDP-2,3-diacylglucosamine hydrolase